jgi:hypothetical protein
MSKYRNAWLPADGIGVEVLDAAKAVLDRLHLDAMYPAGDIGWEFWRKEGDAFSRSWRRTIIVARSFARIFLQNAINLGLRTVVCPPIVAEGGDELVISKTEITNPTTGKKFPILALSQSRQAIIDAGGLIPFTPERLLQRATEKSPNA